MFCTILQLPQLAGDQKLLPVWLIIAFTSNQAPKLSQSVFHHKTASATVCDKVNCIQNIQKRFGFAYVFAHICKPIYANPNMQEICTHTHAIRTMQWYTITCKNVQNGYQLCKKYAQICILCKLDLRNMCITSLNVPKMCELTICTYMEESHMHKYAQICIFKICTNMNFRKICINVHYMHIYAWVSKRKDIIFYANWNMQKYHWIWSNVHYQICKKYAQICKLDICNICEQYTQIC